ncbi:MAG: hypothetical protein ACPG5B_15255 [Chitinophagales bacterium]
MAWNPDAGIINPYTTNANISLSSGNEAHKINDGDTQTFWQSEAPLPSNFIERTDLNILAGLGAIGLCTSSNNTACHDVTDTNLDTSTPINRVGNLAFLNIVLPQTSNVLSVSLKCNATADIRVYMQKTNGDNFLIGTYTAENSYGLLRFTHFNTDIASIRLESDADFSVFEVAALADLPTEYAFFDLGEIKPVGWISTRHWMSDNVASTKLYVSTDAENWTQVAQLNPVSLHTMETVLPENINARYVKLEHALHDIDWVKASIWEMAVYDKNGPFGAMPTPEIQAHTMSELLGVNGVWGWGYNTYGSELEQGKGATHFNRLASHARNYHNMDWDITDPDHTPNYENMANGNGTEGQPWLNWDIEYQSWNDAGLKVQASIQFLSTMQPLATWNTPYASAYNYGYAFAAHFGPTSGNGLIDAMEIGNEPWHYPSDFYEEVLRGMAEGAKAADPNMQVMSCALQAGIVENENSYFKNYTGTHLSETAANSIDIYNIHHYSYVNTEDGNRMGVHPEHQHSSMKYILNDIRFRNINMPNKKIYLSEWGWDSAGGGENCTHSECVTEQEQAFYAVRGALMSARLGLDRLSWYFYANTGGGSSLYARSGLTASAATGFAEKRSFKALESMVNTIGDKHFIDVIQENDEAWVYLLGDENGNATHLAAWRPINGNDENEITIDIDLNKTAVEARILNGFSSDGQTTSLPISNNGTMTLSISSAPLIVSLGETNVNPLTTNPIWKLKVFLEGAYNVSDGLMNTRLQNENLLSSTQPFGEMPWNYTGNESIATVVNEVENIVDWVLVEARNPNDIYEIVARKAAVLLRDGSIVDADNLENGLAFNDLDMNKNYYVVIRSRNHLDVASAKTVIFPNEIVYDFTKLENIYGGESQAKIVANDIWALCAGDINANGVITVSDFNYFKDELSFINEYVSSDTNFDGNVTVTDFNTFKNNFSIIGIYAIRY